MIRLDLQTLVVMYIFLLKNIAEIQPCPQNVAWFYVSCFVQYFMLFPQIYGFYP